MYLHRLAVIFLLSIGLLSCKKTEEQQPQQPQDVFSEKEEVKDNNKPESITVNRDGFTKYYALAKGFTPKQEQIISNMPFSDSIKNRTEIFGGLFLVMGIEE
ncbi:MAG: hypothetical protein DRR19_09875 [Candidatus Parabeggiatoa sp. nov. 1]|nr:MAG: hypothetical protein DRR19_09875 [Gammaproteobacteria bacterium]